MKKLYSWSSADKNLARLVFQSILQQVVINPEKLGGRAEWAKNQLKDKTSIKS